MDLCAFIGLEALFRDEEIRAATLRPACPRTSGRPGTGSNCGGESMWRFATPKIVETGLDLLDFPTILFHETGYSLHTFLNRAGVRGVSVRDGQWR